MKKLSLLLLAIATVLTLSQCKKQVEQITPTGDVIVPITLDVKAASDGQKINVNPNDGTVSFEQNDVVYVGSGGKYVGKLTCRGTKFVGNLTNPVMNEPLYFYFLGNRFIYEDDFTPGVSTTASVDIMTQTDIDNMPVISSAISEEDFTGEGTYHGFFQNKGALVMFNVTSSTESTIWIEGMTNFVVVDFATNKFTYTSEASGAILLPGGSGERWAILLPQNAIPAGPQGSAYSTDWQYTGKVGAVPAIVANGYYVDGIPVTVTTPTGYGNPPDAPTNVSSTVNGNRVKVQWDWVDDASSYYVYKSSTADGQYLLIGSTYGAYYYDEEPVTNNYYKVRAANDFGQSDLSDYTYCHFYTVPAVPTNVAANVSGSNVMVTWSEVDDAETYWVYRSSTADGTYYLIGTCYGPEYLDENPHAHNYYKVSAANSCGVSGQSDYAYCSAPAPEGAINGRFTINANGDKVYFSKGNLQYRDSHQTWKFAEQQYHIIGSRNQNIAPFYYGYIDLFGWGTSGWDNGNDIYWPCVSSNNGDANTGWGYGPTDGTNYNYSLTGAYAQADWGVHNAISNGGNQAGLWRTLTAAEFSYLLNQRNTETGARFAKVTLNFVSDGEGKHGLLLLPDDWDGEYFLNTDSYSVYNVINSEDDFIALQENGVVFLPCAGYRDGTTYYNDDLYCSYWTSSKTAFPSGALNYYMSYNSGVGTNCDKMRRLGCSVRLVQDVQ